MVKKIASLLLVCLFSMGTILGEVVYQLDFTNINSDDAFKWFKKEGFEDRNDAEDLILKFENGALVIGTKKGVNGIFSKEVKITGATRIRIEWGVNRFPAGANWDNEAYREAIGVIVSFGNKKIDSGAFYIPNVPYFIGLFLGQHEEEGKAYTGNYYKKGGRYFCQPCRVKTGQTVVTEFALTDTFQKQFERSKVPPITAVSIEADTRDTQGNSEAFIKKIEFLSD